MYNAYLRVCPTRKQIIELWLGVGVTVLYGEVNTVSWECEIRDIM